jgi:hypothetical protein
MLRNETKRWTKMVMRLMILAMGPVAQPSRYFCEANGG